VVAFTGASPRAGGDASVGATVWRPSDSPLLRPLNRPRPAHVRCDAEGRPAAVLLDGGWISVAAVADEWRVEEEWWRTPIRRRYLLLALVDGRALTLFEDLEGLADARWYRQDDAPRAKGHWRLSSATDSRCGLPPAWNVPQGR
jgi:hypothetical protein